MAQKILNLLLTAVFFTNICTAQTKTKVLIIDNLKGVPFNKDFEVRLCFDTTDTTHFKDNIVKAEIINKKGQRYAVIKIAHTYLSPYYPAPQRVQSIDLPLDPSNGYISLRNTTAIDTIHISKWIVQEKNILIQTTRRTTKKNMMNDSLVSSAIYTDTIMGEPIPENSTTLVSINGVIYDVPLVEKTYEVNGTFSKEPSPISAYRKFKKGKKCKKYSYQIIYGDFNETYIYYTGVVNL